MAGNSMTSNPITSRFQRELIIMMKKFLFAGALLSLAFAGGCAQGGSGPCVNNCPGITINDDNVDVAGLGLSIPLTLTFQHTSSQPVNWSIEPSSCGSACGTLTNVTNSTATYVGPSAVPSNAQISIVATSQTDSSLSGNLGLTIVAITTDVAPAAANVAAGSTEVYTAVAVPDNTPQTFTWSCTTSSGNCANFNWTQSSNGSPNGIAYYTAASGETGVTISAVATVDPLNGGGCSSKNPCTSGKATVVTSRVSGAYAFQFSGFDNSGKPVSVAGTFTAVAGANGASVISTGVEDELTSSGPHNSVPITSGVYAPTTAGSAALNNTGTLSLTTTGALSPSLFQVVIDGAGDIQMVESDGNGTGSGIAEPVKSGQFNTGSQTFAFGFTGVDGSGNRIGYAGILPTNGTSTVTGGLIDVSDAGGSSSICIPSAAPCSVAGSYTQDGTFANLYHLTLTSPATMTFDFYVANGSASNASTPLTLYAISTDSNPAVVGTMTLQDSKQTYNNAAFNSTSVSTLSGVDSKAQAGTNSIVSLTLGTTDGTSSGTGGTGNFTGQFDQNDAGTVLSVATFPAGSQSPNPYTYVATNNNTGRYIFYMLGNPGASPVVPPIPFVLYASGADRGFLLECATTSCANSDTSVMTGAMIPQVAPKENLGLFAASAAPGPYAVGTNADSVSGIAPFAGNYVLTSIGNATYNVSDPEAVGFPGNVTGTYTLTGGGTGTISLTAPSAADYIIYGTTQTDYFMIQKDAGTSSGSPVAVSSPIFYLAQ